MHVEISKYKDRVHEKCQYKVFKSNYNQSKDENEIIETKY